MKQKRILATGYNGAPSGMDHCTDIGCLMVDDHCIRTLHAEQNAIIQAAVHGVAIDGSVLYCTHQPCVLCAKMLINCGVREVHFIEGYPDELSLALIEEAGVTLHREDLP